MVTSDLTDTFHRQKWYKPDGRKRIKQPENAVVIGDDLSTQRVLWQAPVSSQTKIDDDSPTDKQNDVSPSIDQLPHAIHHEHSSFSQRHCDPYSFVHPVTIWWSHSAATWI